jgi:endoglucanase
MERTDGRNDNHHSRTRCERLVPLVAGFNWAYDLTEVDKNPIEADRYCLCESSLSDETKSKPWEDQWTKDWGYVAATYPLFLTEIGFCGKEDRGAHIFR